MKNKKLLIALVAVALILVVALGVLIGLRFAGSEDYTVKLQKASRYLDEGDYDNAILYYESAVKERPSSVEGYRGLYNAYMMAGRENDALDSLRRGYYITGDGLLDYIYLEYTGESIDGANPQVPNTAPERPEELTNVSLNEKLLEFISTAAYLDYCSNYGGGSGRRMTDSYQVRCQNFAGTLYYSFTGSVGKIDQQTNLPDDDAVPEEVWLDDVALLFNGARVVTLDQLQQMRAVNNVTLLRNQVQFTALGCVITIDCDADGTIRSGNDNVILPVPETASTSKVHGYVFNGNNEPVPNAVLMFRDENNHRYTVYCDENGAYSVNVDRMGAYQVYYMDQDQQVNLGVVNIQETDVRKNFYLTGISGTTQPPETQAPTQPPRTEPQRTDPPETDPPAQHATISGIVTDATTGEPVSGATVRFSGDSSAEATTNENGAYVAELSGYGTYEVRVSKDGYITMENSISVEGSNPDVNFSISPRMEAGTMRIVLTWEADPRDLDSHLYANLDDGSSFHVYYASPVGYDASGAQAANLDVDDTTGYGPETITILNMNGTFEYYVKDYTSTGNMSNTQVLIQVYQNDQLVNTVNICPDTDNLWFVLRIDHGNVSIVNTPG